MKKYKKYLFLSSRNVKHICWYIYLKRKESSFHFSRYIERARSSDLNAGEEEKKSEHSGVAPVNGKGGGVYTLQVFKQHLLNPVVILHKSIQ